MKTLFLVSLGCAKNLVDSEVMLALLDEAGWTLADSPEEASLLLINTCGFIQDAVEEAVDEILHLVSIKENDQDKQVVVTGCLVQRYGKRLLSEIPEVDLFIGTDGFQKIVRLIEDIGRGDKLILESRPVFIMNSDTPRKQSTPAWQTYLKTTEGCDNRCSYCLIPSLRGSLRSRPISDLITEASRFAGHGIKELTLIAQDLTAYGNDLAGDANLTTLLDCLIRETDIPWLRLLYLYPSRVTDELLALIAKNARILSYLDIPFQHVSDTVLRRMNREYSSDDAWNLVDRIRNAIPDAAIRTTFMVGFPGETEKDFLEIESFLRKNMLDHVGIFKYANEEGCPAEFYKDQIGEEVKEERMAYIHSVQAEVSQEVQKKYLGLTQQVLVEGVSRETDLLLEGRTRYQAPEIDGCVYIADGIANPGDIVQVKITDTQIYDLVGEIK